jgi:hypothetical protein
MNHSDSEKNRIALLQYESLRKNFSEMVDKVLGSGYYNMGMDVYECDRICCEEITLKANRSALGRLFNSYNKPVICCLRTQDDKAEIESLHKRLDKLEAKSCLSFSKWRSKLEQEDCAEFGHVIARTMQQKSFMYELYRGSILQKGKNDAV